MKLFSQNRWINPITVAGCLSGVASSIFFYFPTGIGITFLPGLFFGIAMAVAFVEILKQKISTINVIGLVAVSSIAYYAAYLSTIATPLHLGSTSGNPTDITIFFSGGVVGAFILLLGLKFLFTSLKWKQLFLLTIFGGLLGMLGWGISLFLLAPNSTEPGGAPIDYYSLFLIWQTGIALAIALCVGWNEQATPAPNASSNSHSTLAAKIIIPIALIICTYYFIFIPFIQTPREAQVSNNCEQVAKAQDDRVDLVGSDAYCYKQCTSDLVPGEWWLKNGQSIGDCTQQCTDNSKLYDTLYRHCTGELHTSALINGTSVIYQP